MMSSGTNSTSAIFDASMMRPYGFLEVFIAGVGVLGNTWLLAATATSSALRSKINILIALLALADLFACGGFFVVRTTIAFDVIVVFQIGAFDVVGLYNYFTLTLCAYIAIPTRVLFNVDNVFMLILGFDCLFALITPTR